MRKIKVYFQNCNTAVLPADKTAFRCGDYYFDFSDQDNGVVHTPELVGDGRVLVNWDAVAWVREYVEEETL